MVRRSVRRLISRILRQASYARRGRTRRLATQAETLETRSLLTASVLSTETMFFDPTPALTTNGDELPVGVIEYLQDGSTVSVRASIDTQKRLRYSMDSIAVSSPELGNVSQSLPERTHEITLVLPTAAPARTSFTLTTSVAVVGLNTDLFDSALPTLAGIQPVLNNFVDPRSLVESPVTPGYLPAATADASSATNLTDDTVRFAVDPGWRTGEAVRVTATLGAPATGLVTTPTATDLATTAVLYVHRLSATEYSFHTSAANAMAGTPRIDITAEIPSNGAMLFSGVSADLSFLGQTPLSSLVQPTGTDIVAETVTLPSTPIWNTGDAVRVTTTSGGLSATTTFYVRVSGLQASFYNSAAGALGTVATAPVNLTGSVTSGIYLSQRLVVTQPHRWTTGTVVRSLTSTSSTVAYVRVVDDYSFTLHGTASDAASGANPQTQGSNPAVPISSMFNMFCIDHDRLVYPGRSYNTKLFSSYSLDQFVDTSNLPKDTTAVQDLDMPANSSLTVTSTNLTSRVLTSNSHGLLTGTAIRLSSTDSSGLSAGVDYYVRVLTSNTFTLHATPAAALGTEPALPLTAAVTSTIFPSQAVRLTGGTNAAGEVGRPGTAWPTGSRVRIKTDIGGLQTNTDYYVRFLGNQLFSLHTTRAQALAGSNPITITTALTNSVRFYVPENLVEFTENLDAVNYLVNQPTLSQLSNAISPPAYTASTVTITAHGLVSGDRFQVTTPTGDLIPGIDYYFRKIDNNTLSVFASFADATAGTTVANTPLNLVQADGSFAAQLRLYYTSDDVQQAIWSLIDNFTASWGYGNGLNTTGTQRVREILDTVSAALPLFDASVDYVPGRGQSVVLIAMPYEIDASGALAVTGQTLAFTVPVDTIEGYVVSTFSTDNYTFTPSSTLSGYVFRDCDNDGQRSSASAPIANVVIQLSGTDFQGRPVSLSTTTATDGSYLFSEVMPGTYTVTEVQPDGYLDGLDSAGSEGGTASNDVISSIVLPEGIDATEYNFAELGPSSLAGVVYVDSNNDGVVDTGETRLSNVTVTLIGTDDRGQSVSLTASTDGNGAYLFSNLRPGSYSISQSQPGGYLDGLDTLGTEGGTVGSDQFTVSLGACSNGSDYNFGELTPSSLAGRVFKECDNDGVFNGGAVGIAGVTLTLTGTDDLGSVTISATSDSDGRYVFLNLRPGIYTVSEAQPAPYLDGLDSAGSEGGTASDDVISSIALPEGIDATEYNFAELGPSSLAGVVYVDSNNDGVVDAGESRLSSVTVTLTGTDDRGQSVSLTASTDGNGAYLFSDLRPGSYTIIQTQPDGYLDGRETLGTAGGTIGSDQFTVSLGACTTGIAYNFGEQILSSISGLVYEDRDNAGVYSSGDPALEGVVVRLEGTDDLGNSVSLTTTTDADGRYRFENLRPGIYTVIEEQPNNYLDGHDQVGSEGGSLSNDEISEIVLAGGVNGVDYNFGEIVGASLAGTVYVDSDDDGLIDAGEPRLPNVLVTLTGTDDLGAPVSLQTTTNANGAYAFLELRPGNYVVTETQPETYRDGKDTLGTVDGATRGTVGSDQFTVALNAGEAGIQYNFGEREDGDLLAAGDTATIGFWANKNGQAILNSLNGGSSATNLAQWLVQNYPNLYGAAAGSRSMLTSSGAYKTNEQVAATYINAFFKPKATIKLETQILASAFATYVTNSGLAGGTTVAARYGFTISTSGTGAKRINVGSSGESLGVANNSLMSISQLLTLANSFAVNGTLYVSNSTFRSKANELFTSINETGDII